MTAAKAAFILVIFCLCSADLYSHELRPAYLEIRNETALRYVATWRVPARADLRLDLHVQFPNTCVASTIREGFSGGAFEQRLVAICTASIVGQSIKIRGLEATRTDVLVRYERLDGTTQTDRLTADRTSFVALNAQQRMDVGRTYIVLGFEHILDGTDHLAFVLALTLLARRARQLVLALTAFTAAHSLTLAAATLGLVHTPGPPVEACIALSIMFAASEAARRPTAPAGISQSSLGWIAFSIGLLHGLGFAGALTETGLPERHVGTALLFFNLGVEAGQLFFVALLLPTLWAISRIIPANTVASTARLAVTDSTRRVIAYAIGPIAAFWTIERLADF